MILNRELRSFGNGWTLGLIALLVLLSIPVSYIVIELFGQGSNAWDHIVSNLLATYITNSIWLLIGTSFFTIVIGVSTAWLVSSYQFKWCNHFEWALILPLSMPSYIVAYTYAAMFDYGGIFHIIIGKESTPIEIRSVFGIIIILSLVLYPYIYLISRTVFQYQSSSLLDASKILGKSQLSTFFKVALPLARPGIFAGTFLVIMEVLNEYGAVKYFGVSTFITGIFRAWFSMGDTNAAIRLSACLLIFIFILIIIERKNRGRTSYTDKSKSQRQLSKYKLKGLNAFIAFIVCFLPVLLGFLIPTLQLCYWSFQTASEVLNNEFYGWILNSFYLGFMSALIAIIVAIFIVYTSRINKSQFISWISKLSVLGYTIPGAIIAIGIMAAFLSFDKFINSLLKDYFNISIGLLLSSSTIALIFAYLVRFLAMSFNSIESGFEKIAFNIDEASRSLGVSSFKTLLKVDIPLLKHTILTAGILVFVEVTKELPLTLILRPFNFDTLAIKAYELASDEMIAQSASPALIVVLISMVPVIFAVKLMKK